MPEIVGLEKYVHESPRRHAFMTEVARLAVDQDLSQEKLAKAYGKAVGSPALNGGNIDRHFNPKTPRPPGEEVRGGYADALGMSKEYVRLLLEQDVPHYRTLKSGAFGLLLDPLADALSPESVKPVFEDGAVDEALGLINSSDPLRDKCLYEAELAACRYKTMKDSRKWAPTLPIDPDALTASAMPDESNVKWAAVARVLKKRSNFDLASRLRRKDEILIRREELLSNIFEELYSVLGEIDVRELEGVGKNPNDFAGLDWDEWLAVEHVLKLIFNRRRWPVDKMLERLQSTVGWTDFRLMHDVCTQSYLESHKVELVDRFLTQLVKGGNVKHDQPIRIEETEEDGKRILHLGPLDLRVKGKPRNAN